MSKSENRDEIYFGTIQIPFSSDPLDFDYYTHHYAFSSVFGRLVSTEKSGTVFPVLAESWSNQNNFKEWRFKIRKNITYSNGDNITIEDIQKSLKRIAFLKNKKKSKSGLLEYLKGFEGFTDMRKELEGIKIENNEIVLYFNKPMPDLLSLISFGFYGVAHPRLYDSVTGEWLNKRKVISSGSYEVIEWTDDRYVLSLRNEPYINSDKKIKKINFVSYVKSKNAKEVSKVDLLVADKMSLMVDSGFEYAGSTENLKIGYVRVNSWNKKNSPLSRVEVRQWLRSKFYNGLRKTNFPITNSFLPLSLTGVQSFPLSYEVPLPKMEMFDLVTHTVNISGKIEENKNKISVAEAFDIALKELGNNSGVNFFQRNNSADYDVEISGTGIESNDYLETLRFMFLSKEGIRLPDSTGLIYAELEKENPDVNLINKELWNQAIIWPIRHYSSGYWFNKNSNLDWSEINLDAASIDFQFLKWK